MAKTKTTELERLATLNATIANLQARAKKLESAKRVKDSREDQRRAFLIGETILAESNLPEAFRSHLAGILEGRVKRPADRELLSQYLSATEVERPRPKAKA